MKNIKIVGNQNIVGNHNNVTYAADSSILDIVKDLIEQESKNQSKKIKLLEVIENLKDNKKKPALRTAAIAILNVFLTGLAEKAIDILPRFIDFTQTLSIG